MEGNKSYSIPSKTISWLRSSQTPSIQYLIQKNISDLSSNKESFLELQNRIPTTFPVNSILEQQDADGNWGNYTYYTPKYSSTHWAMCLLSELEMPPEHDSIQAGAGCMLKSTLDEIPDFYRGKVKGMTCFWGSWLRYMIYCGYLENESVQMIINFICSDISRKCVCDYNNTLPCAWGIARGLYGLALLPAQARTKEVEISIRQGIHFLIDEYDLTSANYPPLEKIHPLWFKLNFPLFYRADILFVLRVLGELNALSNPQVQPALLWLQSKINGKGYWRGASPFRKRTYPFVAEGDSVNHWVTYHAVKILNGVKHDGEG